MPTLYKRIMIFGRPGSGKSTFAHALHKATGIPLHHLDKYFYTHHWVERNYEEFLGIQYGLVEGDTWIIDGNATRSLDIRWQRADLVLYLNYPLYLCYWRIFKRLFSRRIFDAHKTIDDRAKNCPEIITWKLLKYMRSFDKRVRPTIHVMQEVCPDTPFYVIHNDAELRAFAQKIEFPKTIK